MWHVFVGEMCVVFRFHTQHALMWCLCVQNSIFCLRREGDVNVFTQMQWGRGGGDAMVS